MIKKLLPKNSTLPVLKNRISAVTVVFVFVVLLVACSKKQASVPAPVPSLQTKTVTAVKTKPVQKQTSSALRLPPPSVNQFDFSNKKDPFKPFVAVKEVSKGAPERTKNALRNALPIHSFDVNQFRLIGVITGGRENQAMVTDPGGKGYVLKVGMMIGKNDGKVVSINSSGVDILEQFRDDNGRVRKEKIKLTLPKKQ